MIGIATATERNMSEAPQWGPASGFDAGLSNDQQTRFVAENMRRVFLTIHRIVGNVADAQDLTQEAFIKALQRQDQLKDLEKAAQWVSRIARNTAIDFLRRSGRLSFAELEELPEPALRSRADSPEQVLLRSEHYDRLEAGLSVLTERERTALLRGSGYGVELLQSHGAVAYRQRAGETAPVLREAAGMSAQAAA
jgi:RNA polymerase sigma factor (sigma-70 family)